MAVPCLASALVALFLTLKFPFIASQRDRQDIQYKQLDERTVNHSNGYDDSAVYSNDLHEGEGPVTVLETNDPITRRVSMEEHIQVGGV